MYIVIGLGDKNIYNFDPEFFQFYAHRFFWNVSF